MSKYLPFPFVLKPFVPFLLCQTVLSFQESKPELLHCEFFASPPCLFLLVSGLQFACTLKLYLCLLVWSPGVALFLIKTALIENLLLCLCILSLPESVPDTLLNSNSGWASIWFLLFFSVLTKEHEKQKWKNLNFINVFSYYLNYSLIAPV